MGGAACSASPPSRLCELFRELSRSADQPCAKLRGQSAELLTQFAMLKALQGRIGRKTYWAGTAFSLFLVVLLLVIITPSEIRPVLSGNLTELWDDPMLVGIAAAGLWLLATVNAKRLHDRDRSAWWLVAPALLLASIAVALSWRTSGPMLAA